MQHQRGQSNFSQPRPNNSIKNRFELSLQKVRSHMMPKKLHLRTDIEVENVSKMPQSNKHAQSTKNKTSFKRHSREKSDVDRTVNVNTFLFREKSHKPSKRHSLKDDIHNISINRSTFIGRKGSTTNNNSIDKIYKKNDYSPYKDSLTKYKATKTNEIFKSRQPSGKIRRNLQKLKTQQSRDEQFQTKQGTLKTTPESYNLIQVASRPKDVIGKHAANISMFQQAEILEFDIVYFLSRNPAKQAKGDNNLGFDDEKGRYLCGPHDQVAYRFEIIDELGRGSFGQVYKAFDHKHKCQVALKIIRNKKTPNSQAKIEYALLKYIKEADEDGCVNVVQVKEAFQFRRHFCMTFQILSYNLYQLIKINKFLPLSSELVRRISIQALSTLLFLYKHNIIHCDIKPENILLKSSDKSGIKLIDFGSSCFGDQKLYTYIQSRYYRAPEVILGHDYSVEIDMWSFGCVAAELKLSYPIFSGEDQLEQVALITEVIGTPKAEYAVATEIGRNYFGKNAEPLRDREGVQIEPKSRLLTNLFSDPDFADFLTRIFVWDPKERITPLEALRHKWIIKGLPAEIRRQHSQYLAEQELQIQQILKRRSSHRAKLPSHTLSEELLAKALKSME